MKINHKTKIVCTIGPATDSYDMIHQLAATGMNIVRFNFSHDVHENHARRMELVRQVGREKGYPLAIMMDTKGPEIRVDKMENDNVNFATGDRVRIVRETVVGNNDRFSVNNEEFFNDVKAGDYILIDDGKIRLNILENEGQGEILCEVSNFGVIKTRKGCIVPGVKLSMPFVSEADEQDLRFACKMKVDYIAVSFARRKDDILEIRKIVDASGWNTQIIAKIENQEGYDNLDEILEVSDGIMVARGDLGLEVESQMVPIFQKKMIEKANGWGKPVITATHMLESMLSNPTPTRAEASDVANAILDGTDAIMLSGETAVGAYPKQAVETMATIATEVEKILDYRGHLQRSVSTSHRTIQDSIGMAVAETALNIDNIKAIVAFTQSGTTARRIAKYRPAVPILAVTFSREVVTSLACNWGVFPIYSSVQNDMYHDDELASTVAKRFNIEPGSYVTITAGYPTGIGTTNMMKIVEVK